MHIVIINPKWGNIEWARVFDTYKSCDELDKFLDIIPKTEKDYIVCVACKDDCITSLSEKALEWFHTLGSKLMYDIGYRNSFAFIS